MKKEYKWLIASSVFGAVVVGIVIFIYRNKIKEQVWDAISYLRIQKLHPKIRESAILFLKKAEAEGIKLRITSGLRTFAEQTDLYAQGRTKKGSIVTNAKAGYSSHNYGTAFDVVPIIDGKSDWETPYWNRIGEIGKSIGFAWGGDWNSIVDKPHFEMNFGKSIAELRNLYNKGQLTNGYVNI